MSVLWAAYGRPYDVPMSVVCARCPNCNVWTTLGPTIGIWHASGNEWDDAFDELCVTCIMLKVTAAKVNRLATASGLGVAWDFVRGHYAREAQEMAKRETRRWYLTLVLGGKPYGTWTMFHDSRYLPYCQGDQETMVMRVVKFVVGPQAFLQAIDTCPSNAVGFQPE